MLRVFIFLTIRIMKYQILKTQHDFNTSNRSAHHIYTYIVYEYMPEDLQRDRRRSHLPFLIHGY
jgi:hypothetical protein